MNIYNVFATCVVVLTHLQTNDRHVLIPLLDAPESITASSVYYIFTPPSLPLTIDPSPPVLAPPFDPNHAPALPHTFISATSARDDRSISVDWMTNVLVVVVFALLVHVCI